MAQDSSSDAGSGGSASRRQQAYRANSMLYSQLANALRSDSELAGLFQNSPHGTDAIVQDFVSKHKEQYDSPEQAKEAAAKIITGMDRADIANKVTAIEKEAQDRLHDDGPRFLGIPTGFWKVGAMAVGGALSGVGASASASGAGAAASTNAASGLAGTLGMNSGAAATALNSGALNTGLSLVQGKNIGDSLKSGAAAAALSGVGGWAKAELGGGVTGSVGAGALTGAVGAGLTGQDVGKGALTGAVSGGISEASKYAGGEAFKATGGSQLAGKAVSTLTNTVLRGGSVADAAASFAGNTVGGWAKQQGGDIAGDVASAATQTLLTGKKPKTGSLLASMAGKAWDYTTTPKRVTPNDEPA